MHIPIKSPENSLVGVDYALLLAWIFKDDIIKKENDFIKNGGKFITPNTALQHIDKMITNGADIIDIGAESTRPGAKIVSVNEERKRIEPVLKAIKKNFNIPISIDTYKPEIMELGIDLGVEMINDIYALRQPGALDIVANSDVVLCLMHMQGDPDNMQNKPLYKNIINDVSQFLQERIHVCSEFGIDQSRLVLDPGFGFGKTHENNLKLFQSLGKLRISTIPLLVGVSRKSMVRNIIGDEENDIIQTSAIMAALSVLRGAKIVRVHDVIETKNALKILKLK
jgi:dihydropteroate synthase